MDPVTGAPDQVDSFRQQVKRILASQEFSGLRQLREFLIYVSEASFEGRSSIEQVEIAERVLHRGKDFNPLDDASVRKHATILRQRLKRYYESEGVSDTIVVSLPVRSYVPHFEVREESPKPVVVPILEVVAPASPKKRWQLALVLALCAALTLGVIVFRNQNPALDLASPRYTLITVQGDIMHEHNDLPGSAIRLGPAVGEIDEVTARLRFTPERATQQAGIFIFSDADEYVKLGRQFLSRPQLEFGFEHKAHYEKPANTFTFDTEGQTGEPLWLSIRRNRSLYSGFVSSDGMRWRRIGNILEPPGPMKGARAGIYAHNGRSNAPAIQAVFDSVSVGLAFHNWPEGPADLSQFPGWTLESNNAAARDSWSFDSEALDFTYAPSTAAFNCKFVEPAPKGDWAVSTRLDFLSVNGATAGLVFEGNKGEFRLIRWDLDGGSITSEFTGNRQTNRKDYPGSPPVILRMESRNGVLKGSFSRDDIHFEPLPLDVPAQALGENPRLGLYISQSSWTGVEPSLKARFYYFRREISHLDNYR